MSTASLPEKAKRSVYALIDGFNMYHALDYFPGGTSEEEREKYRKYKWLCYWTLLSRFIDPAQEELTKVIVFTAYPYWDEGKRKRQQLYLTALKYRNVQHVLGEFKESWIPCKATCKEYFDKPSEKQTDVNIATSIIELAGEYDVLILVTADSDQVPAIRLLRKLHPNKIVYILPPIGRNSKELVKIAGKGSRKIMQEEDLAASILPNPVDMVKDGKVVGQLWKPAEWPMP